MANTTETIGNVTLDLRFYGGADLYCDGAVEDELLEIVKEISFEVYNLNIGHVVAGSELQVKDGRTLKTFREKIYVSDNVSYGV